MGKIIIIRPHNEPKWNASIRISSVSLIGATADEEKSDSPGIHSAEARYGQYLDGMSPETGLNSCPAGRQMGGRKKFGARCQLYAKRTRYILRCVIHPACQEKLKPSYLMSISPNGMECIARGSTKTPACESFEEGSVGERALMSSLSESVAHSKCTSPLECLHA